MELLLNVALHPDIIFTTIKPKIKASRPLIVNEFFDFIKSINAKGNMNIKIASVKTKLKL